MSTGFTGRRAVVTGGTRGIGHEIARQLREAGAEVLVTGRSGEGAAPDGCAFARVDFLDEEELEGFTRRLADERVDVLINNAGINRVGPFAEYPKDEFERIQRVNVHAPFRLCRAVIGGMVAAGWGRIVNISSIWGKVTRTGRAAYSSSKFGLDGMSAALAVEVAAAGVLVNCVAPGFVDTELTRRVLGDRGMAEVCAQVPIGRLAGTPEIARLVVWLAGPENTYLCAQNIAVDGGFTRV